MAIENAAPELRTNVQVTVSPMIDTGWPGISRCTASTLVTMSSASTTTGDRQQQAQALTGCRLRFSSVRGHRLGRAC